MPDSNPLDVAVTTGHSVENVQQFDEYCEMVGVTRDMIKRRVAV